MEAHHAAAAADPAANVWRGERGGERVSIDVTPARRFDADDTEALGAYFAEHGYVVVRRAADEAAVERGTALLWEFLEAHTARADGLRRLGMRSAHPERRGSFLGHAIAAERAHKTAA